MALAKVKPPVTSSPEDHRMIQDIYKHINGIIDAVNQSGGHSAPKDTEGKPGDLRLVRGADGEYYLNGRFEEGWVGSVRGAFKFQSRQGDIQRSSDVVDQTGATIIKNVLEKPVLDTSGFGGGGEVNTASNLGGGLANYDSKSGVDLRFNSFNATDFDLASNLISIDYVNGQKATGSVPGFLTAADWTTFNNKQSAITPAALTKTDDTNITLTLGGSPATSLLAATSLTLGWSGTLAISRGGTGQSTAANAINALLPTQTGNNGKFLTTDGSVASWATVSVSPGGADSYVQYNNGGSFGGEANFVWDDTLKILKLGTIESVAGAIGFAQPNNPGTTFLFAADVGDDGDWSIGVPPGNGLMVISATSPLSVDTKGNISVTAGALTKTDDTNVTLTLGGSPTTALLAATSLTLGWTGVLAEGRGGTNQSTYTLGDILYSSASNTLSKLAGNTTTTKKFLRQTGNGSVSAAPAWDTVVAADVGSGAALTKTDDTNVTLTLGGTPTTALLVATSITLGWTGQLGLTRGGTAASLTASNGGIVYSTGSALAILAGTATAGLALISGASTTPSWFAPTAGSVIFAGTSGILQQDNANFFWDDSNNRLGILTAAPTASLSIAEKLLVSSAGLVTKYNNVATVGQGISAILASVSLTTQGGAIGATTLYAVPASSGGLYRIVWYMKVTRAASSSSTLGALTIAYTDAADSVAQSLTCNGARETGQAASSNAGNATTSVLSGTTIIYAAASTNITYAVNYASSGGTSMQYEFQAIVERLT